MMRQSCTFHSELMQQKMPHREADLLTRAGPIARSIFAEILRCNADQLCGFRAAQVRETTLADDVPDLPACGCAPIVRVIIQNGIGQKPADPCFRRRRFVVRDLSELRQRDVAREQFVCTAQPVARAIVDEARRHTEAAASEEVRDFVAAVGVDQRYAPRPVRLARAADEVRTIIAEHLDHVALRCRSRRTALGNIFRAVAHRPAPRRGAGYAKSVLRRESEGTKIEGFHLSALDVETLMRSDFVINACNAAREYFAGAADSSNNFLAKSDELPARSTARAFINLHEADDSLAFAELPRQRFDVAFAGFRRSDRTERLIRSHKRREIGFRSVFGEVDDVAHVVDSCQSALAICRAVVIYNSAIRAIVNTPAKRQGTVIRPSQILRCSRLAGCDA